MPKTFHILSIWIFTESFQGSYHCFYVTFHNTETQKFNNVSKNFKAKIFVLAGWGGKSKHHIIFAFIFYATKLYFVYNVNFVAFQSLSHSRFFVTPWTVAHQAPLSIGFSRQEYWSVGFPFLFQGIFLTQGLNPCLLRCRQTLYGWTIGEAHIVWGSWYLCSVLFFQLLVFSVWSTGE